MRAAPSYSGWIFSLLSLCWLPLRLQVLSDEDAALLLKEDRLSASDKRKRDEVRAQVIAEIQSTEQSYVNTLDALTTCFVQPLKERMSTKAFHDIKPDAVDILCSNLETLANFHHMFISQLMLVPAASAAAAAATADAAAPAAPAAPAAAANAASTTPSIPSVFLRFSEFFRLYIPYLNGYEKALNTFNSLHKHKKFQEWLSTDVREKLKAHAIANGASQLDLLSYMIQPVQRVPRYVLLLKELKVMQQWRCSPAILAVCLWHRSLTEFDFHSYLCVYSAKPLLITRNSAR